jgi:hypothetical protein
MQEQIKELVKLLQIITQINFEKIGHFYVDGLLLVRLR